MLGFVMKGGHAGTGIFISLILPNSVADKSNQLKVGDCILEVACFGMLVLRALCDEGRVLCD